MNSLLTSEASAVLSAQLAFIRGERRTQRRQPRLFASRTGAPLPRQQALTALCDRVAEQLVHLVESDACLVAQPADARAHARAVAVAVAERVARYGDGIPQVEVEEMAAPVEEGALCGPVSEAHPDPFALLTASVSADGLVRWWPRVVPRSVSREALMWEPSLDGH